MYISLILGECPEWQRGLTVNQLSFDFVGSSPTSPTNMSELKEYICESCNKKFYSTKTFRKDRHIKCDECKQKRKHSKENELNSILDCSKRTISKILKRSKIGCAICEWNESTCDIHHIIEKSNGGTDDISNLIIVCPNHHRMIHTNKCYSIDYLQSLSIKNTFNNWKDYYHPER